MCATKKNSQFRVVIAGGGIGGLTLANALQHANIDFVLLERRDVIDPEVGASIGLVPNGLRILDQLGCLQDIERLTKPLMEMGNHWEDGSYISPVDDSLNLIGIRFGYHYQFLARQALLKILYERLWDKSKVLLGKKIVSVAQDAATGVQVRCEDGSEHSGDIVIGADGVHSKTREEMSREANAVDPETFPAPRQILFSEYQCLYGISDDVDGFRPETADAVCSEDKSILTFGALNKRVYFFLFKKYVSRYEYGSQPRQYSREEAESYVEEYLDMGMRPNRSIKFRDIWQKRISFTLVPLEEGLFETWTWQRFAILGDAVHKMTPNAGQGGNAAIEGAAALANELYHLLTSTGGTRPSLEEIEKSLRGYQQRIGPRIMAIARMSADLTRTHSFETPSRKYLLKYLFPLLGDVLVDLLCDVYVGAESLEFLPIPSRSLQGTLPFNPSAGTGRHESRWRRAIWVLPLLIFSAIMCRAMMMIDPIYPVFEQIYRNARFEWNGVEVPIINNFTGISFFDNSFGPVTIIFAQLQFFTDPLAYWQSLVFITEYAGLYAVVLFEACRRANRFTIFQIYGTFLLTLQVCFRELCELLADGFSPLFFVYYAQLFSIGILGPIYFASLYIFSPVQKFAASDARLTNRSQSAAVLPALLVCYYVPHFISYFHPSLEARHWWDWIWQLCPIWVSAFSFILSKTVTPNSVRHDRLYAPTQDLGILRTTVGVIAFFNIAMWWYTLGTSDVPVTEIFVPKYLVQLPAEPDVSIRTIIQYDYLCSFGGGLVWLAYLFGDLKRAGMCDYSSLRILLVGAALAVVCGPGTAFIAGWIVREELLATRRHKDAFTMDSVNRRDEKKDV